MGAVLFVSSFLFLLLLLLSGVLRVPGYPPKWVGVPVGFPLQQKGVASKQDRVERWDLC